MKTLTITLLALSLHAAEIRIDQPERWYDPSVSHHGLHAYRFGAPLGIAAYSGIRILGGGRPAALTVGIAIPALAGIAWEVVESRKGAWIDPVDILWTAAGGAAGALLTYSADRWMIAPAIRKDRVSLSMSCRF